MQIERHGIFPTPIWRIPRMDDHPENALSWALSIKKENEVERSNRGGGFQSESLLSYEEFPYIEHLKKKLVFLPNFAFGNWWVNVNEKGGYNIAHTHPNCDLSVVWYLTDNRDGLIKFINPTEHTRFNLYNHLNIPNEYEYQCDAGDILVFPADLMHYVEANQSNTPRVSVSFNLSLQPYK